MAEKLCCLTCDIEMDYGWRVRQFNILKENRREIAELGDLARMLDVPLSLFIVTRLLDDYPELNQVVRELGKDWHTHSHTHNLNAFNSRNEFTSMVESFKTHFGYHPLGYRAPLGVLRDGEIDLLKECGLSFSASVFPSYRPGQFNYMDKPTQPFRYENGLLELPFATFPKVRAILSLSYLKLYGWPLFRLLAAGAGLPEILVLDSHLHDYFINETSFRQLPLKLRLAWGRNGGRGNELFTRFVHFLRERDYRFLTMTELYEHVKQRAG